MNYIFLATYYEVGTETTITRKIEFDAQHIENVDDTKIWMVAARLANEELKKKGMAWYELESLKLLAY